MMQKPNVGNYIYLKERLISWFRYEMLKGGGKFAVIGISGGKDSTVTAAIAAEAIGPKNVIGVMLPNGDQRDIDDAVQVCDVLGINKYAIDIAPMYDKICSEAACVDTLIKDCLGDESLAQESTMKMNLPPRIRMTILRAIANRVPGGRLINTSNLSEFYMGYFTKDGDSCGDLFPLLSLTKTEVVEVGKLFTQIPTTLIEKAPADGLTGKTDEEVLGVDYECIDEYIRMEENGGDMNSPYLVSREIVPILKKHDAASHKFIKTPIFFMNKKREEFFRGIK